jgi:hypothetical protein
MLTNSPYLMKLLVDAHVDDLRRAAASARLARVVTEEPHRPAGGPELPITIRPARPADAPALRRLAESDSAAFPAVPVLVAEANGELRAAVSLHDGAAIAHPFHHTAWMVQLLDARAAQLDGARRGRRRHRFRTHAGWRRWAL